MPSRLGYAAGTVAQPVRQDPSGGHMRTRVIRTAAMGVICLLASSALAQDTLAIASRDDFVDRQCVPEMRAVRGETVAKAMCECGYRNLAEHREITRRQFDAAFSLCVMEYDYDQAAFLAKYRMP